MSDSDEKKSKIFYFYHKFDCHDMLEGEYFPQEKIIIKNRSIDFLFVSNSFFLLLRKMSEELREDLQNALMKFEHLTLQVIDHLQKIIVQKYARDLCGEG